MELINFLVVFFSFNIIECYSFRYNGGFEDENRFALPLDLRPGTIYRQTKKNRLNNLFRLGDFTKTVHGVMLYRFSPLDRTPERSIKYKRFAVNRCDVAAGLSRNQFSKLMHSVQHTSGSRHASDQQRFSSPAAVPVGRIAEWRIVLNFPAFYNTEPRGRPVKMFCDYVENTRTTV